MREGARARVMAYRQRGRSRPAPVRALLALAGLLLLAGSVPAIVVLPEAGVPAMLLALRLLAVEFDWAASAFTWVTWRWGQLEAWFRARSAAVRTGIVVVLLALGALVVWLLVAHLA